MSSGGFSAMRIVPWVLVAISLGGSGLPAQAALPAERSATSTAQTQPTVSEAETWMAATEADLAVADMEREQANWVAETYINDDTQALAARARARYLARMNRAVQEARRFEELEGMPADLQRKLKLLKLNGSPTDASLLAEMTQLSGELSGMYGKGKYCRRKPDGAEAEQECLGIDEIDQLMAKSRDPMELQDLWLGWHKVGAPMREKYARLVQLKNQGAREFGFKDTGDLWRAGYDMPPGDFSAEMDRVWGQLRPFYMELQAYVRAQLIHKYGAAAQRADGMIPAHLLGNMWAQEWGNVYDLVAPSTAPKTYDLEAALKAKIGKVTPQQAAVAMVRYGEAFYVSLGFEKLPETFWQRSMLVRPADRDVQCHASAWDVDDDRDVRLKMCIHVVADDFVTVHHELGHNYYQMAYRTQPYFFRDGANDGFHEAIGDSIALSITPAYLKELNLIDAVPPAEADVPLQLRTALDKIAFLPFGLLIDKWRWQVFSGETKPADYNKAWWELREKYQGVAPPVARSDADFDPGAKFHIPANVPYARYFLARVYQFQFYKAMCDASGYQGPLNRCSFYESKEAGRKLNAMLEKGRSQPWQATLKEMTGTDHLDAGPMLEYFAPLLQWLKEQNARSGVKVGWTPETQ
jgi:peptidyl-dipeptidase A